VKPRVFLTPTVFGCCFSFADPSTLSLLTQHEKPKRFTFFGGNNHSVSLLACFPVCVLPQNSHAAGLFLARLGLQPGHECVLRGAFSNGFLLLLFAFCYGEPLGGFPPMYLLGTQPASSPSFPGTFFFMVSVFVRLSPKQAPPPPQFCSVPTTLFPPLSLVFPPVILKIWFVFYSSNLVQI